MKFLISLILFATTSFSCFAADPVFKSNYEEAIESKNSSVIIIFGTDWCGGCVKLKKDIGQLNLKDYVVCVVDAEERKDLSKKYKIKSYPTSIVMKDKKEISRKVGYTKIDFQDWVDQNRK